MSAASVMGLWLGAMMHHAAGRHRCWNGCDTPSMVTRRVFTCALHLKLQQHQYTRLLLALPSG